MRLLVILLVAAALTSVQSSAQSMMEATAVVAGTTIGSAAGKKLSDGINASLKKSGGILKTASGTGEKAEPEKPAQSLKISAGVPKVPAAPKIAAARQESHNVPLPPPLSRRAPRSSPAEPRPRRAEPAPLAAVRPPPLRNVDLGTIVSGTTRDSLLQLGQPSARITMFDDGHLVEIFQYTNARFPSGSVRLRDGEVSEVVVR